MVVTTAERTAVDAVDATAAPEQTQSQAARTDSVETAAAPPKDEYIAAKPNPKRKRKRKVLGWTLLCCSVVALAASLAIPKAAQDERVRAAVSDGVTMLNHTLVEHLDVSLDGFLERLANLSDTVSSIIGDDGPRPGQIAAAQGLRAHHPVIIIPGFVTSGLELWEGEACAADFFRQRLWGTLSMAQTLLADRSCWLRHMKLDPVTGSDPAHIKLRAAKSLEAVDYFVPGYWVFSKMVQSLADLGYDNNNLVAVPYDWRLPIAVMEARDGFFTRVKSEVELQYKLSRGIKPVMVSHSYGAIVCMAFFSWIETEQPGWVDKYMHGYVNLAGPVLGLPKALSPLLSGETRETVDMMAGLAVLVEQYLGKQSRAGLFRTWGSVMAMIPVGGDKVWGNATFAPDDDEKIIAAGRSYGGIIARVHSPNAELGDAVRKNDSSLLSSESLQLLRTTLSNWGSLVKSLGSTDSEATSEDEDEQLEDEEAAAEQQDDEQEQEQEQEQDDQQEDQPEALGAQEAEPGSQEEAHKHKKIHLHEKHRHRKGGGEVRFQDITSTILSLAMTAGQQFTLNLQRWSPAAHGLDFSRVLEHHRKEAEHLAATAAEQQRSEVDGGNYKGSCPNTSVERSQAGSAGREAADLRDSTSEGCGASDQEGGACSAAEGGKAVGGQGSGGQGAERGSDSSSEDSEGQSGAASSSSGGGEDVSKQGSGGASGEEHIDEVVPVNPVRTPLPKAPNLKLYCMYGVGTPTERGYHYLKTQRGGVTEWSVNNLINDPDSGLESGVQLSPNGDGTVPLLSLGAICSGGWKTRRLNPSGLEVIVREYPNNPGPVYRDARGGPGASTHVEILGNDAMLKDLLMIVAGQGSNITEQYHTDIRSIASKIPWDDL